MQGEVQRARVLVVDDEQLNRALCKRLLSAEYDVLEAVDGPSALALLQKQTIDLVLLDVMMPGMNGLEVCGQIKAAAQGFLPVLFLTSLSDQAERNAALHAGGDDFLTKPFDKRELRLRVSAFVRLRRQDAIIREQLDRLRRLQALKDDLVSLVVHDLRNPLAGILAYVEVLRGQPGVEREDLEQLLDSAKRMRTALEEVLQIRMLEEGEIDTKRGPLRMGDVVREAISAAGPQAR